jgi:ATP/maltotriose-dependent transcriptional regulator MalT
MRQAAESLSGRAGGRRIIERPRLIKLLEESSARTILLIAPAGYGKTTLARQWAERQPDVHWYTARTGSADVAQLAVDLAGVLETAAPGLVTYVNGLMQALPNPSQTATQIVDRFTAFTPDLTASTLVIDDYQAVAEDEQASTFVHEFQERLGVRLLVASRVRPRWASARLQVYGDVLELGAEELALTLDEALQVLERSAAQASSILEAARGWPAVLGLAARASKRVESSTDAAASTLFRYFAEELFRATSAELQEQLLTLALLPNLTPALVERALATNPQPVIEQAVESGLASRGQEIAELHPLIREYLLTKLASDRHANYRIRSVALLSLRDGLWDHAFSLVTRFKAHDLLDHLINATFKPLVSSGRIATLEQIATYAHAVSHVSPLVDLIDAELAFRNGLFARAEAIAAHAARALGDSHSLASHAWWIAGQGADLTFDEKKAILHFERARSAATTDEDLRDALWGEVIAASQSEGISVTAAVEALINRRHRSPIDCVRATAAEIILERFVGTGRDIQLSEAMHAQELIDDPRIRTSFMNACVYFLILRARYDEAYALAETMRETAAAYQLKWAQPHAHWALAASAFGRRQMAESTMWLRRVERWADDARFGSLILNSSCLRARELLAVRQPENAWSALMVDETLPADRAMRGEFFATKALTLAVLGEAAEARAWVEAAHSFTRCVEARAYSDAALAVLAIQAGDPSSTIVERVAEIERLATWDAFVSSVRAYPPLLKAIRTEGRPSAGVIAALRNAHDYDLSREVGLDIGRRPRGAQSAGALSPREAEVLDLVRQGLTNEEIAQALFISKSTVKVHVQHIMEKTGARSRTEAATATDDI